MSYCIVELITQTATFRNPEFQNFHKSFLLPPPTTLMGLAGAAMGLSPKSAQDFFKEGFYFGVYGTSKGYCKDLWKYNTFDKQGSIILKEIYFDNHFILIYGNDDADIIKNIMDAFLAPAYALTLGNNDSLAKIIKVSIDRDFADSSELSHCLVEGNIVEEVIEKAKSGVSFSIYSTSEPIAYDLPMRFQYESDYGVRRIVERKTLSFIGESMQLNFAKKGIRYKNKFIPIFNLN
ncbi:MAG TPA: CRISPR-associated protein Cas5 [Hanamia sp.]